jgi:DNA topoisomerase-1
MLSKETAKLIKKRNIKVPPAWKDVWISPNPNAKLQATGYDARGRKQYIYHPKFREKQENLKYRHIARFAKALPKIRSKVKKDLSRKTLDLKKVNAAIIALIEATLIRVGNDEYARKNNSYGLTTLKDKHVRIKGSTIEFNFLGKSKKEHNIKLTDKKLSPIVKKCRDLPGKELFQYMDEKGKVHDIHSAHINKYLKEISGEDFTAKDFRTWAGTVLAAIALREFEKFDSKAAAKSYVKKAIERVAEKLGNTPAICKKCYIHPGIIDSYLKGNTLKTVKAKVDYTLKGGMKDLQAHEGAVLAFLQKQINKRLAVK